MLYKVKKYSQKMTKNKAGNISIFCTGRNLENELHILAVETSIFGIRVFMSLELTQARVCTYNCP